MLEEMNQKHSGAEDAIHNWLCDQECEELFEGILKKEKSIKGALKYCSEQASKQKDGNVAMIADQTVFGWVYKYFTSKKLPKSNSSIQATVKVAAQPKKTSAKKSINNSDGVEQLSLLDMS
ncbi:hypothetical protein G7082_00245 [Vagococcus hydrophili]|uniref:PcfK-like protein n=2 Tax=Vagococcus hydrophili TaxID=2714947 RepID=A0A6G8AXL8_9ENTE|nr:hypothetical protein G7082_00245 [Vagococcus hydrophili]